MNPSSNNLSIIETEIDSNVYDIFLENAYCDENILIEKAKAHVHHRPFKEEEIISNALNDAITLYFRAIAQNAAWINKVVKLLENKITTTKYIIIHNINPKIHQKFRKYIKKKYQGQNFQYNYNLELNLVIYLCIMKHLLPIRVIGETIHNAYEKGEQLPELLNVTSENFEKEFKEHANTHKIFGEELETACQKHGLITKNEEGLNIYALF